MAGVYWRISPTVIGAEIDKRAAQVRPEISAVAKEHAKQGEAAMKSGAPWNDRSGAARAGLYGEAEGTTIALGHTVHYGPYLELGTSKMAARPIVQPVAEQTATAYFEAANEVVRKHFG